MGNNTLVSEIRRSIRLADTTRQQQSNESSSSDKPSTSKPTFSIFDGTGKSDSPWAAFIFSSEDETDSEDYNKLPISADEFESEEKLEPNDESEISPAIL